MAEQKTGTIEEFEEDVKKCGFYPDNSLYAPLEASISMTRHKVDTALQQILAESGLPLSLFDLIIDSVQKDIRKADIDVMRMNMISVPKTEA